MSNPTPFQIGQQVGQNFAPSIERQKDASAIDDIFAQVQERETSGGQSQGFDDLMGQIIQRVSPQNQKAAIGILQNKRDQLQKNAINKSYAQQADKLEAQYPGSEFHKGIADIYRSNIPADKKNEMVKTYIDTTLKGEALKGFQQTKSTKPGSEETITDIEETVSPNSLTINGQQYEIPEINRPEPKGVATEEEIQRKSLAFPQQASLLQKQREQGLKSQEFAKKEESKQVTKILEGIDKTREGLPGKKLALQQIADSIEKQTPLDTIAADLAVRFDAPWLRTKTGAGLNSAVKELFIEDLSRFKNARPNQFLERMLSSALADPRNTKGANQIINLASEATLEMDEAKIKVYDELKNFYMNRDGSIPSDITAQADKILAPMRQDILDKTAYKTRQIVENNMSERELKNLKNVTPGTYLTDRMIDVLIDKYDNYEDALKAAKKLGFTYKEF